MDVVERQGAVGELAPVIDFRQDLEVAAMPLAATSAATARFVEWAEGTPFAERHPRLRLAGRLSALASLASFLLAMTGLVPIHLWLFVLVANYAWTWIGSTARSRRKWSACRRAKGRSRATPDLLHRIAARDFAAPGLVAIRARLEASGLDAAAELGRLHRLSELSDVRHSSVHTLLQAAMAWDLLLLERVARLAAARRTLRRRVARGGRRARSAGGVRWRALRSSGLGLRRDRSGRRTA